jgi:hypothetical protein
MINSGIQSMYGIHVRFVEEWDPYKIMTEQIDENNIQAKFEELIKQFVGYRKTHGGIMIPDVVILDIAFSEALYETGLRKRPPSYEQNEGGIFIMG